MVQNARDSNSRTEGPRVNWSEDFSETQKMVLPKCKCLHEALPTSYHEKLEYVNNDREIIMKEVSRWQAILSVNYTNYNLENSISI